MRCFYLLLSVAIAICYAYPEPGIDHFGRRGGYEANVQGFGNGNQFFQSTGKSYDRTERSFAPGNEVSAENVAYIEMFDGLNSVLCMQPAHEMYANQGGNAVQVGHEYYVAFADNVGNVDDGEIVDIPVYVIQDSQEAFTSRNRKIGNRGFGEDRVESASKVFQAGNGQGYRGNSAQSGRSGNSARVTSYAYQSENVDREDNRDRSETENHIRRANHATQESTARRAGEGPYAIRGGHKGQLNSYAYQFGNSGTYGARSVVAGQPYRTGQEASTGQIGYLVLSDLADGDVTSYLYISETPVGGFYGPRGGAEAQELTYFGQRGESAERGRVEHSGHSENYVYHSDNTAGGSYGGHGGAEAQLAAAVSAFSVGRDVEFAKAPRAGENGHPTIYVYRSENAGGGSYGDRGGVQPQAFTSFEQRGDPAKGGRAEQGSHFARFQYGSENADGGYYISRGGTEAQLAAAVSTFSVGRGDDSAQASRAGENGHSTSYVYHSENAGGRSYGGRGSVETQSAAAVSVSRGVESSQSGHAGQSGYSTSYVHRPGNADGGSFGARGGLAGHSDGAVSFYSAEDGRAVVSSYRSVGPSQEGLISGAGVQSSYSGHAVHSGSAGQGGRASHTTQGEGSGIDGQGFRVYAGRLGHETQSVEYNVHPKYQFEYAVNDPHTGDIKSQKEERDGDVVKGIYIIHEPDGTIRTVEYIADDHNGFRAAVIKSGSAAHSQNQESDYKYY